MKDRTLLKYATVIGMGGIIVSLLIGGIDPKTGFPEPITVDGQTIEFTWTDDNKDENLIIYTDKATYTNGVASADVYVAVENRTGRDQNIELMGYFRDSKQRVKNISVLTEVTTEEPVIVWRQECKEVKATSTCKDIPEQRATTTISKSVWRPLAQLERSDLERQLETTKLAETVRKPVEGFTAQVKSSLFTVPTGRVAYYKVLVEFPAATQDNFYFEAIGDQGGYGHLDPWFNASWNYRVSVTVDDAQVPSTQTSFPVYVNLNDLPADFHTNVKSDGCDIRVVEADETTETAFELVAYDSATDTGELHFMADSLTGSGGGDTTFYIYYGNSGASCYAVTDTYGRNAVWSNYSYVYHFQHSSGDATDSTANGNTLTNTNTVGYSTSGKLGSAADGGSPNTSKYFTSNTMAVVLDVSNNYYHSYWMKPTASKNTQMLFMRDGSTEFRTSTRTGDLMWLTRVGSSLQYREISVNYDDTNWRLHHTTVTSANSLQGYINGATSGTSLSISGFNGTGSNILNVGGLPAYGNEYFTGLIDEVRIAQFAPSTNWITTEYNNQNSSATFYTVGSQEANTPATIPEPDDSWFN